jgi:hypothetical protein
MFQLFNFVILVSCVLWNSCTLPIGSGNTYSEQKQITNQSDKTAKYQDNSIDFSNFSFPPSQGWAKIKLVNGQQEARKSGSGKANSMGYSLVSEVNGDCSANKHCSIAVLSVQTGGSAIIHLVYIFDTSEVKPELIWLFESGDRADGGLRNVYLENSNLVLETYESENAKGDCCPQSYKSTIYQLEQKVFKAIDESSKIPNPNKNAMFVGGALN